MTKKAAKASSAPSKGLLEKRATSSFIGLPLVAYEKQGFRAGQTLVAPIVSERAVGVSEKHNQVLFKVLRDATKPEIRAAVELMFKVEVVSPGSKSNASYSSKGLGHRRYRVLAPAIGPRRVESDDLDAAVQSVAR